jgi:hypothetical protein
LMLTRVSDSKFSTVALGARENETGSEQNRSQGAFRESSIV